MYTQSPNDSLPLCPVLGFMVPLLSGLIVSGRGANGSCRIRGTDGVRKIRKTQKRVSIEKKKKTLDHVDYLICILAWGDWGGSMYLLCKDFVWHNWCLHPGLLQTPDSRLPFRRWLRTRVQRKVLLKHTTQGPESRRGEGSAEVGHWLLSSPWAQTGKDGLYHEEVVLSDRDVPRGLPRPTWKSRSVTSSPRGTRWEGRRSRGKCP